MHFVGGGGGGGGGEGGIDLIHDTRHLCTRFRIDGIKAMLRGISGGSQNITFAYSSNRSRFYSCLDFLTTYISATSFRI